MITRFDMRGTDVKSIGNYKGNYAIQQNKVKSRDSGARLFSSSNLGSTIYQLYDYGQSLKVFMPWFSYL